MRLDNSRYTAFLANPEKYRLTYEQNLVPVQTPFALARGGHFHKLNEARNKSLSPVDTKALLIKNHVEEKARQSGEALFSSFKRRYDGHGDFALAFDDDKPLAELEFDLPIPRSGHRIVGAIDEVISYKGDLWVGDTKTANAKATEAKKKLEFNLSSQPLFYINAARMMGYPVVGMLYRVVTEHNPPNHWIIPVRKSERQLSVALLSIHQVAEQIEFMRAKFGIDNPWPHSHQSYPCSWESNGKSACEYSSICMRKRSEMDAEDLEAFKTRDDHLHCMQGREFNNV